MPTSSSRREEDSCMRDKIPVNGFMWHGTCASIINKVGLLFAGDGLARKFNPDDPTDNRVLCETEENVFCIGNRMLVSVTGNGTWIRYILGVLIPEIENSNPAAVAHWNCKRCAQFVRSSQAMGPDYVEKLYKKRPGYLKGATCSMMFGAYEKDEAKLFYGDESCVEEILDAEVYVKMQDKKEKHSISWRSMGSGRFIANQTVEDDKVINIYYGNLSHVEDQLDLLLSAMRDSCVQNVDTGGVIQVYYMPPPPGVAHIIYNEFHTMIPVDILRFKANLYQRLYESAREADSLMAAGYRKQLLHFSDLYESELQKFIDMRRKFVAEQDMQEPDQQLVELQRRTRELVWFKSKWRKLLNLP